MSRAEDPVLVRAVNSEPLLPPRLQRSVMGHVQGRFVAVRPVESDKTHLGVYLGELPISVLAVQTERQDNVVTLRLEPGMHNPCIWVPDLNQLVYGIESWWRPLGRPEDLSDITDADITNIWYMQALEQLLRAAKKEGTDDQDD